MDMHQEMRHEILRYLEKEQSGEFAGAGSASRSRRDVGGK